MAESKKSEEKYGWDWGEQYFLPSISLLSLPHLFSFFPCPVLLQATFYYLKVWNRLPKRLFNSNGFVHLPLYLPTYPIIHPTTHQPTNLPTYLPTYLFNYQPFYLPTHPSKHSLNHSFTHQPICLCTYIPTYLLIYLHNYLHTNQPTCLSNSVLGKQ